MCWRRAGTGHRLGGGTVFAHQRHLYCGAWTTALLLSLLAVALATNPGWSDQSFKHFLRFRRTVPILHRLSEALGVINVQVWNLALLSIGWEGSNAFLGAFCQWVELAIPWPPSRDGDAMFYTYIIVFVMWQVCPAFMQNHCTASRGNISAGRFWCLATAQISHMEMWHLITNICFLYTMEQPHHVLGRWHCLALYFMGGLCGIVASLALSPRLHQGLPVECLGASGSLFALLGFWLSYSEKISGHVSHGIEFFGRHWTWLELAAAQMLLSLGLFGIGSAARGIDVISHLAGGATGWLIGKWY